MIIFTSLHYPPLKLGFYVFPHWAYKLGWGLISLILSGIVFYALYAIIHLVLIKRNVRKLNFEMIFLFISFQSCRVLINPEDKWGPLLDNDRKKVYYYHGGHQGALVSVLDSLKKRTLSRETLARSKVS